MSRVPAQRHLSPALPLAQTVWLPNQERSSFLTVPRLRTADQRSTAVDRSNLAARPSVAHHVLSFVARKILSFTSDCFRQVWEDILYTCTAYRVAQHVLSFVARKISASHLTVFRCQLAGGVARPVGDLVALEGRGVQRLRRRLRRSRGLLPRRLRQRQLQQLRRQRRALYKLRRSLARQRRLRALPPTAASA